MNLVTALKARHVWRWHIVHATKQQSVAEHQWAVWLIATAIYDVLFPIPHNSFERADVALLALTHDLPEVVMGDMPSTGKALLSEPDQNLVNIIENRVMDQVIRNEALISQTAQRRTLNESIVKMADITEAANFAKLYIPDSTVYEEVKERLKQQYIELLTNYPNPYWGTVRRDVLEPLTENFGLGEGEGDE